MNCLLVGSADLSGNKIGGQLEKTRLIYNELKKRDEIFLTFCNMFTLGTGIKMITSFIRLYFDNDYIIIVTSNRGTKVMIELIWYLRRLKKIPVFFLLVGNQVEILDSISKEKLKIINKYYFEVDEMRYRIRTSLETGFFSNCKEIKSMNESYSDTFPIRICFYSEISQRKGFDILVQALDTVNHKDIIYLLDVYGYFSKDKEEMLSLINNRKYIEYKGAIKKDKSSMVLPQYLFMVLPSRHKSEGVPGSVVDAYESGVPVISSKIGYLPFVVKHGETGYIFEDIEGLIERMKEIAKDKKKILSMRRNCLNEAKKYDIKLSVNFLMNDIKQYFK